MAKEYKITNTISGKSFRKVSDRETKNKALSQALLLYTFIKTKIVGKEKM